MRSLSTKHEDRQFWVFVTGKKYYLDPDGRDRRSLEPGGGWERGGWWTCHRDTRAGDGILIYRTRPKADLAYVAVARSDAYSLLDDPDAEGTNWDYGCDFEVLAKAEEPLSLGEMRTDPILGDWGALRAGFRRRVYSIPDDIWDYLLDRLRQPVRLQEKPGDNVVQLRSSERDIEDRLAADLSGFRPHGYDLTLCERQHACRRGGRSDLLCFDERGGSYVVLELKRGMVCRSAVAQTLSYMASISDELPSRRQPRGVIVGDRIDNEAAGIVGDHDRLSFISLESVLNGRPKTAQGRTRARVRRRGRGL
jgi:EVE domain/Endonuclease NucS C-terminal domain